MGQRERQGVCSQCSLLPCRPLPPITWTLYLPHNSPPQTADSTPTPSPGALWELDEHYLPPSPQTAPKHSPLPIISQDSGQPVCLYGLPFAVHWPQIRDSRPGLCFGPATLLEPLIFTARLRWPFPHSPSDRPSLEGDGHSWRPHVSGPWGWTGSCPKALCRLLSFYRTVFSM